VIMPIRDRGAVYTIGSHDLAPDAILVTASNYLWPEVGHQWPVVDLEESLASMDRWVKVFNHTLSEIFPKPPSLLRNAIFDYVKRTPHKLGVDKIPNVLHSIEDDIAWKAASDEYRRSQL